MTDPKAGVTPKGGLPGGRHFYAHLRFRWWCPLCWWTALAEELADP
jgi:hypothetical protein